MKLFNIKFLTTLVFFLSISVQNALAESATMDFTITIPPFLQIQTVTSPVLVANITDRTGNLQAPLVSKFRVLSNSAEKKTLYLKANTITENGNEEAMFEANGRVYIAFANLANKPKAQSLANCKLGSHPKDSPGVVAYPINSILGTKHQYQHGKGKYEIYIENGTTDISVNVGSNVLVNSFSTNDPKGFYQATLSLTESDI